MITSTVRFLVALIVLVVVFLVLNIVLPWWAALILGILAGAVVERGTYYGGRRPPYDR